MKFITDPYVQLPVRLKTVSEFRQTRCDNGRKLVAELGLDAEQLLPVPIVDAVDEIPTTFCGITTTDCNNSALSQFMSKALDFESAFEFADKASDKNEKVELGSLLVSAVNLNRLEEKAELSAPENRSMDIAEITGTETLTLPIEKIVAASIESDPVSILDQASVLRDPQEVSSTTCTLEKDEQGRVVKALYCGGESVWFHYDENSELVRFNYAGMDWTKTEESWSAQDRQTEYSVEAKISVLTNGSIRVEKDDVVRVLKISGTRIDEHKSGSRTESRKLKNKPSPYDLLAKAKAVSSLWLTSSRTSFSNKGSGRQASEQTLPAPLKLDLVNENGATPCKPMIGSAAKVPGPAVIQESSLACVPSTPIELRSLERTMKLRSMEDTLVEPHRQKLIKMTFQLRLQECLLKSRLWLTDRLAGQSSPKHLAQLDRLAEMYQVQQRNDLAELTHQRALHIREQFFGKGQPELAASVRGLARIYEARGNFQRAEEMFKEAIELQENGLRKILFLYSEKVTDSVKLGKQLDELFGTVGDLSNLYSAQRKPGLCAVVYEKALALAAEIIEREPAAEATLNSSVSLHLDEMKRLGVS